MALSTQAFESSAEVCTFVNGAAARGWLLMIDPQHITDEQVLTLNDGTNPATNFRFDLGGDGVGGGATAINISAVADEDKAALATAIASAINGVAAGLAITATAVGDKVALVNDAVGAAGNQPITQSGGSMFLKVSEGGMTGGSAAIANANLFEIRPQGGLWHLFWTS